MSELIAWIADRRAGRLIQKPNGNLQFRYDPSYDGPPLSQSLPQQDAAHPHAVVRAVFGGLLPEGDVREVLAKNLGISPGNDYALLEEVGGDVAGAMTLLPPDVEPAAVPEVAPLDDRRVAELLQELPQRPLAADAGGGIRLSLAGAQAKLPVIIDESDALALPLNAAAPTTHILKPEPDRFPGLVDNEAFCMSLARACELPAAPVRKAVSSSGRPYLVVERYDRDLTADPIRRLHQEDVCQALGLPADKKYQAEGGPTVVQTADLLRRTTPLPAQELPRFVRALVFNWLIGNCDAHGKNFSLLYDQGAPALAPLYDLVSTVIYPELTTRLAMSIDGARRLEDVDRGSWERLAADAGFRPAFVLTTVSRLVERAAVEAAALTTNPDHANPTAERIAGRVQSIAEAGA